MNDDFEIIVLGVGDTFSERYHPTSLLLRCGGFQLALDCPDQYRAVLHDAGQGLSLSEIDHVLITHVHGDHMNGLEGVAFYKRFADKKRVHLVTSPEARQSIWDQRLKASMSTLFDGQQHRSLGFGDYFEVTELSWAEAVQVGPFRIRARRTVHHVPTSALLIEAGGRCLGYSSDTAFDPSLIEFLSAADLIVHETNLGPAHTPYASLAALPEALRRRMRLNHYPDTFDKEASVIQPLREGQVIRV